jgi:hypothetical protein
MDASAIPLLDEVVDPQEFGQQALPHSAQASLRDGEQKTLLEALREGITAQLSHDLRPIVATAVAHTVEQITEQARQLLQDELNSTLEGRLRLLIEAEVAKELKKLRP